MSRLLDWPRSSETGKMLSRNIWANLATKIKLHYDIIQTEEARLIDGDWAQILTFWDEDP